MKQVFELLRRLLSAVLFSRYKRLLIDANDWVHTAELCRGRLDKHLKRLASVRKTLDQIAEEYQQDVENARDLLDKYQPTMDAIRSRVEVLEDTLVPELVSAHRLCLERMEAEIAVQVKKKTAAELPRDSER